MVVGVLKILRRSSETAEKAEEDSEGWRPGEKLCLSSPISSLWTNSPRWGGRGHQERSQ